jgi:hypothetical protein
VNCGRISRTLKDVRKVTEYDVMDLLHFYVNLKGRKKE